MAIEHISVAVRRIQQLTAGGLPGMTQFKHIARGKGKMVQHLTKPFHHQVLAFCTDFCGIMLLMNYKAKFT